MVQAYLFIIVSSATEVESLQVFILYKAKKMENKRQIKKTPREQGAKRNVGHIYLAVRPGSVGFVSLKSLTVVGTSRRRSGIASMVTIVLTTSFFCFLYLLTVD